MPSPEKAKSDLVAQLVRLTRKERLSYDEFGDVCQQARKKLGLKKSKRERKLPQLLTEDELMRFFRAVRDGGRVEHEIMLKLLFFTAVRVGELVRIKVGDGDLTACKIFVDQGKGSKDRYLLFPQAFGLVLRAHLAAHPKNVFLFETQRCGPYTVRRVQQIVQRYREAAGLSEAVRPHLFRHQMLLGQNGRAWARLPADLPDRPKALRRANSAPEWTREQEESGNLPTPVAGRRRECLSAGRQVAGNVATACPRFVVDSVSVSPMPGAGL